MSRPDALLTFCLAVVAAEEDAGLLRSTEEAITWLSKVMSPAAMSFDEDDLGSCGGGA